MSTLAVWLRLGIDVLIITFGYKLIRELMQQGKVSPFIRTRTEVAREVAEAFGTLPEGSVLYDPGCGDGRVLFAVAARNSNLKCVGIELRYFPYFLARRQRRIHPDANVQIIHGNSYKQDLSPATHIYTYLYPKVMDTLLPKLERELKPDTQLISLDFQFSKKDAECSIPLASGEEGKLGRTLYVYRF